MTINENKVKLSGSANLSAPLELTKNYDLVIKNAEVRKVEDLPNDDNSYDKQFTIKISELSEIQIIGIGQAISAKKKGSQAKVLRFYLEKEADNLGLDRETYYQEQMTKIIQEIKERNEY